MSRRRRRLPGAVATMGAAALVVAAACAGWAFTVILSPAAGVPTADGYTLVSTAEGDVGSHLTLNVAAEWNLTAVGTNEAAGVVTTVDATAGQLVASGDRLYSVNLRPVVAARGAVPAYRAIEPGDTGADVAQVQSMLTDLGFYSGEADGRAGVSTVVAIDRWQQASGVEQTGDVLLGDVVFVPVLPARLALTATVVHRGATLSGGEAAVQWLGAAPAFTLPLSEAQSQQVSTGTRVVIDDGSGDSWNAVAAGRTEADTGTVVVALQATAPESGAAVCGDRCDVVPVDGQTLFPSRVVTVETAHGIVVPSAALQTDAGGRLVVVDAGGVAHPVQVGANAAGQSLVTGVAAGVSVRVPTDAVSAGPPPAAAPVPVPAGSASGRSAPGGSATPEPRP